MQDQLVQDAVIRNVEIIGEASNNIEKHDPDFAAEHPELPFGSAYEMRNAVAHGYFKVDFEIVWKTIHGSLPGLHAQVGKLSAASPGTQNLLEKCTLALPAKETLLPFL